MDVREATRRLELLHEGFTITHSLTPLPHFMVAYPNGIRLGYYPWQEGDRALPRMIVVARPKVKPKPERWRSLG